MFPFVFEWRWDIAHLVFMGALWYALGIIGLGLAWCVIKSVIDTVKGGHESAGDGHH